MVHCAIFREKSNNNNMASSLRRIAVISRWCQLPRRGLHTPVNFPVVSRRTELKGRLLESPRLSHQAVRTMFIQTQDTPNPQSLKFLPGRSVLEEGGTYDIPSIGQAVGSPLAKLLFRSASRPNMHQSGVKLEHSQDRRS